MSGKRTFWNDERLERLVTMVRSHIATAGHVDWVMIAADLGTTSYGANRRYVCLGTEGLAPPVSELLRARRLGLAVPVPEPAPKAEPVQQVTSEATEKGMEAEAFGPRIKTLDQLLTHVEADLTTYEVERFKVKKYELGTKGPDGLPCVTPMWAVSASLKPKAGPNVRELVEAMIGEAFATKEPTVRRNVLPVANEELLEVRVIPEPHIGKFAWNAETGWGDYDIPIACDLLEAADRDLAERTADRHPARRVIAVVGDFYHYDSPQGHTTKGTPLDRDGRVQKMIAAGARVMFDIIERSALTAPTDVILAPGNHDEVLTWALQNILLSHYRNDSRVTINGGFGSRKYYAWGRTLLGFTHGDKPKKAQLPALMAAEVRRAWGTAFHKEIHTGHTHATASIDTIDGTIVRTFASISAADKWHAENGYVGAPRTMESWFYSSRGYLRTMESTNPTLLPRAA